MARAAMEEQTKTGSQIKVLEEQVKIMGTKLRTVQSLASQTSRDANDAYNTAINIYQQAKSIEVPSIDEENIEKQANRVQEEAIQIKQEVCKVEESLFMIKRYFSGPKKHVQTAPCTVMAVRVVEFSNGGYKNRKIFV